MKKCIVWLLGLCLVLSLAGCSSPENDSLSDPDTDKSSAADPMSDPIPDDKLPSGPLVQVRSGGVLIEPYAHQTSASTWTGSGWLSADMLSLLNVLPDLSGELSTLVYADDLEILCRDDVTYLAVSVYSDTFESIHHYTKLSVLESLPAGSYYLGISVRKQGDYIESEGQYETSGYECAFQLIK